MTRDFKIQKGDVMVFNEGTYTDPEYTYWRCVGFDTTFKDDGVIGAKMQSIAQPINIYDKDNIVLKNVDIIQDAIKKGYILDV